MSKFVIRAARLADIPEIVDLAVESVSRDPLPVKIDRVAMHSTAHMLITGNQHFAMVAEADGKVVAAVGACVQEGFWHERMVCSVLMFYGRAPGATVALLRAFAKWVKSRPAIKIALFSLEPQMDARIGLMLRRLGFSMETPQFIYVRGMQ